jgi:nitroreductase
MLESRFLTLAAARRSIRKYKTVPVEREKLDLCLEAARLAPSACNAQPYKFVVLEDPAVREKFCASAFAGVYAACKFAAVAPALVLVVSETGKFSAWLGNQIQDTNFRLMDIGIAAEHFVLEASEQGLGTCWIGWFNARAGAKAIGLGSGRKIEVLLAVGYPDEAPAPRPRRSAAEFSSYNKI